METLWTNTLSIRHQDAFNRLCPRHPIVGRAREKRVRAAPSVGAAGQTGRFSCKRFTEPRRNPSIPQ